MEYFKDVVGYEGLYQVSNEGRVLSLITEKILKPYLHKFGYHTVCLADLKGGRKYKKIHRLVLEAFRGKSDKPQVNHINHIRNDNNLSNLEYVTCKENVRHCINAGRNSKPPITVGKLSDETIRGIRAFKGSFKDGMKKFSISQTHYYEIRNRKRYADVMD